MQTSVAAAGKRLFAKIVERWPVKVLSVVAAIVLFVFHRMGDLQERFFSVPLRLETSGNLVPSSSYPHNIRVTLRGSASNVYPVMEGDIEAYLDLSGFHAPGTVQVPVQVRKKGTALEAESLEIGVDPVEISIALDTKASRQIRIVPDLQGSPAAGFELVSYTLEPNYAIVDGPQSLVNTVIELTTAPVDLQERNENFTLHLKVSNPDPLLTIRGDGMAVFTGSVSDLIMIRTFDNLPIGISGLSDSLWVNIDPLTGSVRLEGSQRILEHFEPPEDFLSVDLSGVAGPGSLELPVQAALPEGLTLSRQEPSTVRVSAENRE
jgi:YbbR domain-containing protein